ncbi:cupin domain-containing protein [uncultured Dechloromonas sp.]|uniref:cupin domain-containing protein n=1 Tax=uncultured Dechloromonas sp. TaxID=171719 RepID=UPI002600A12D|nr:cupin domain-containing protein [uncultured Dechloromonas sp.]
MPTLTVFSALTPEPSHDHPRPDRLVSGNPRRTTWEHFLSANGDLSAGIWACEPGAWNIAFAPGKDEFFCVIAGRLRISDDQGKAAEFGPGDACVIPSGFTGTFEVLESVRKHYVLIDRPARIAL